MASYSLAGLVHCQSAADVTAATVEGEQQRDVSTFRTPNNDFSKKIIELLQDETPSKLKRAKKLWKAERSLYREPVLPSWKEMEHVGFDPKIAASLYGQYGGDGMQFCIAGENYHDAAVNMIETSLGGDSDLDRVKMAMNIVYYMDADFLENFFLQKCENCNVLEKDLGGGKKLSKCAACKTALYCSKSCQIQHWKLHKMQCINKNRQTGTNKDK